MISYLTVDKFQFVIKCFGVLAFAIFFQCSSPNKSIEESEQKDPLPNIILIMADDLGWGDVAYNNNPIVKTPHLDEMATNGIRFDRFYAAAPVCSPTRASCLTGRHPYRTKITWAGDGHMPKDEITLAEALKTKEYVTGHFGKWHVGGLSKTIKQSYFPGPPTPYSPPWQNGFDVAFSTESMMPTYNPYYHVGGEFGTLEYRHIQTEPVEKGQQSGGFRWRDFYWTGPGQMVDEWLEGDDSKIIVDEALQFIENQANNKTRFFSVIWFHAVHSPIVAGPEDRDRYADLPMEQQHWYGSITAMDQQIGRLRKELERLGIRDNTLIWFCSDNGPSYIHNYNSAGPFRGKKAELLEGGICVPGIMEWPAYFKEPQTIQTPVVTSDFYPTILGLCEIDIPGQSLLDGENIWPILKGERDQRLAPIGFRSPLPNRLRKEQTQSEEQWALVDHKYKLISMDNGDSYQLYDIVEDQGETTDLSERLPEITSDLQKRLTNWSGSLD